MVRAAKEYIAAGDIFQVVLSQRLSRATEADPFTIYRALRMLNPSPYMFFLDFQGVAGIGGEPLRLIGSSPEMHVRLEDGTAYLHPIAGTRWRGKTAEEDAALADDLLADPKERAEHVMLVDLGRNDLGRVCEYGTVNVPIDDGGGALQPRHAHRQRRARHRCARTRTPSACCGRPSRPAPSAGRPRCGRWRSSRNWRACAAAPYAGAVGYIGYDGADGYLHHHPHDRHAGQHVLSCRRAAASWPTATPPMSSTSP